MVEESEESNLYLIPLLFFLSSAIILRKGGQRIGGGILLGRAEMEGVVIQNFRTFTMFIFRQHGNQTYGHFSSGIRGRGECHGRGVRIVRVFQICPLILTTIIPEESKDLDPDVMRSTSRLSRPFKIFVRMPVIL